MKIKSFAFVLCLALILGCGQTEDSEERHRRLIKAIESTDWSVQRRAFRELGRKLKHKPSSRNAIIRYLFSEEVNAYLDIDVQLKVAKVLAQAEQPVVSELINAFRSGDSSYENMKKLLVVLGRMGPKAKSAIPFLLEQLVQQKEDPELEGAIRAVLLNIGYRSEENLATLLSDIRNRTEGGNAAVSMMGQGSVGPLTDDEIIVELVQLLDEPSDESAFAAIALGYLSRRAKPAAANLKKLVGFVRQDDDYRTLRIIYGLSLAKVDPAKSGDALRNVLKYMGSEDFGNHTDFAAMDLVVSLIDPNMLKEIGQALEHKDLEVIGGALWMLWSIGFDGREYTPKVLKILKESPDEDIRETATLALSTLADVRDIPALQAILGKEQSEFVRDNIIDAIRVIRLEEEE